MKISKVLFKYPIVVIYRIVIRQLYVDIKIKFLKSFVSPEGPKDKFYICLDCIKAQCGTYVSCPEGIIGLAFITIYK